MFSSECQKSTLKQVTSAASAVNPMKILSSDSCSEVCLVNSELKYGTLLAVAVQLEIPFGGKIEMLSVTCFAKISTWTGSICPCENEDAGSHASLTNQLIARPLQ